MLTKRCAFERRGVLGCFGVQFEFCLEESSHVIQLSVRDSKSAPL